jgi:class 3 adenylate cyclase/tetratricopeptide (TPR) repeat protein
MAEPAGRGTVRALDPSIPAIGRSLLLGERRRRLSGTVLWTDIRGFTALSEQYVDRGPAGSEQLRSRVNAVFASVAERVHAHGGDVILLAGDGVLALFEAGPGEPPAAAACRAASCAHGLQAAVDPAEGGEIEIHAGLASGEMWASLVGGVDDHWHVVLSGAPLIECRLAEAQAARDRPVLAPSAVAAIGDGAVLETAADGFAAVVSVREVASAVRVDRSALDPDLARLLVPRGTAPELDPWLAETRQISAVFVDVSELGNDPTPEQLQAVFVRIQRAVLHFGGAILTVAHESGGLTVLAVFGLPMSAHEDDAKRALRAGDAIRSALQGSEHRVALGVATGRALCGSMGSAARRDYVMVGNTVNLAARLMQGALSRQPPEGGRPVIWCDAATFRQAADAFGFSSLPPLPVRGRSTRVPLYRVGAATVGRAGQSRATRVVGRRHELETVGAVCHRIAGGECVHMRLSGEAGVGKSVLLGELAQRLKERGVMTFTGQGDAVESSEPYRPLQPIFGEIFGLEPDTDGSSGLWLVEAWLGDHAPQLAKQIPLVGAVTSFLIADNEETGALQGKLRADETQAVLVEILREATGGVPTTLLLEDAHWFDSATWAVLERVLEQLPNVSLAVTRRPSDGRMSPGGLDVDALFAEHDLVVLELEALGRMDVCALAEDELAVDDLPADVADYLVDRSAGNPFYALELTRALRETGGVEVVDRVCRISEGALPAELLPESLQATVVTRLDRLSAGQSLALKVASVLGPEFSHDLLSDVHPVPEHRESLRDDLDAVARLNLLRPSESVEAYYSFNHELTRDVVYSLLLPSQRRDLHTSVALRLERDAEAATPATVAYHWTMSTRAGGDVESAGAMTRWAVRAALMHLRENALFESAATLGNALEALEAVPPGPARDPLELQLQVLRAIPLTLSGGWASPQVIETYQRAQELCDAIGPGPEFFPTLVGVFTFLLVSGRLEEAYRMALANDEIARGSDDPAVRAEGAHDRVTSSFYTGRLADTVAGWGAVEASYRDEDHLLHTQMYGKDPFATGLGHAAMALALMGRTDEALRWARRAVDHTRSYVHPFSYVWSLTILAIVHELRDEPAEMAPIADEMVALCEQHGFPWIAQALAWRGWARARAGEVGEGVADIQQGLAIWEMTGSRIMTTHLRAILAEALLLASDPTGAAEQIETGLAAAHTTGEAAWEPMLLRARGDAAAAAGDVAEAARSYRAAVARSRELGAELVALRALLGLADIEAITRDECDLALSLVESLPEAAGLAALGGAASRFAPVEGISV